MITRAWDKATELHLSICELATIEWSGVFDNLIIGQRSVHLSAWLYLLFSLTCDVPGSALISRLTVGALADFLSPYMLASLTLGCSGLAVFLIWGIASTKIAPLMAFSAVFGLLCGGFTSLGSGLAKDLAGNALSAHF